MADHPGSIRSTIAGLAWPALPDAAGALMLSVQHQLEHSQWWPTERIEAAQLAQAGRSLAHAYETSPFHRERLAAAGFRPGAPLDWAGFRRLPRLARRDVQEHGRALASARVPPEHGRVYSSETSGSTGSPITYYATDVSQFFWRAFTLRDHLWHRRDLSGKLAAIRPKIEARSVSGWGPSTDVAFHTGPCATLNVGTDIDVQLDWVAREAPAYLISNAHNVYGLAQRSLERGVSLPSLREARTFGGVVLPEAREAVRRAWNVPLTDIYTAEEVGYMALQCPEHAHYHLQPESVLVEVLGDAGNACGPGEIGKVVVTTLHNFAMPLVRYEIGDYAEAGPPCPCGRGLPVIARILGRQRNLMTMPNGARRWPSFPSDKWSHLAPVRQLQLVQKSVDEIVVRVVAPRSLTPAEKGALVAALQKSLGHFFRMPVEEVAEIPRAVSYKFEDFISEIAQ